MVEKLTPTETVWSCCVQCLGMKQHNMAEVENCQGNQAASGPCPFYPYRMGERMPVKVFRKYCLCCQGGSSEGVSECQIEPCPCYPYRFGKNPAKKGQGASAEHMKKVRESRNKRQDSIFSGQGIGSYCLEIGKGRTGQYVE